MLERHPNYPDHHTFEPSTRHCYTAVGVVAPACATGRIGVLGQPALPGGAGIVGVAECLIRVISYRDQFTVDSWEARFAS
jgi:hypothetical protein